MPGPLADLRILDLSRILAGPTCTQLLGDLGAEVIKVERPGSGDDTRHWGPPYLQGTAGKPTAESAYYLSSNRNKLSVALDLGKPQARDVLLTLLESCDVLIENFKVGGAAKLGLGYDDLKDRFPRLIYCSITGFGQTGPYAARAGYDFLAQGMGGIMSLTGDPQGAPMKVGVGITDVMCGMYATVGILSALHHRDKTGQGQAIDVSLLDAQVAWLINEGLNYLTSGQVPQRRGNAHPNIVPYEAFRASDGWVIIAVGNDEQFRRFCDVAGHPEWADDPRFARNDARVTHRQALTPMIAEAVRANTVARWVSALEAVGVPCGPVNDVAQAFADPQVAAREMQISIGHPTAVDGEVKLIGNPLKLSRTPVTYRRPPPLLGQHTEEVLASVAGLSAEDIRVLKAESVI